MPTLYDLTEDLLVLQDLIEQATVDPDGNPKEMTDEDKASLAPMVDELIANYETKAENILKYRQSLTAFINTCKAEEERIAKRRKSAENKVSALMWILEESMRKLKTKKLTAGTFTLTMQKNKASVYIILENKLPAEYWRIIPEKREPDKILIYESLTAGKEVPGAALSQSESLRIR
jgi:hypothetical protein